MAHYGRYDSTLTKRLLRKIKQILIKLDTLANELQIQIPRDRHRALTDYVLTAKFFLDYQKCKIKEVNLKTQMNYLKQQKYKQAIINQSS